MKISRSLLDLAALSFSLAPTVYAAPATTSPDALSTPSIPPHFQIDLTVVPSQLSARDTDITVDHSLGSHNFFGNEDWAVGVRPNVGPVWIHKSRWRTLLDNDDAPAPSDIESNANVTALEARQYYYGWPYYSGYYYPYYGYGSGYGYYAKRDGDLALEKRDTCPAQSGYSNGCNSIVYAANQAAMYPYNGVARAGWAPKMNVYSDSSCSSYITSVIGSASCVTTPNRIRGIITFNQEL
ncbi:hypothetical protein BDV10DRAFT_174411 [Aspergillus recurvatus]